jgi:hypothetical protein
MCPHSTLDVSAYYYICVRILLYVSSYYYMCPHTAVCVLILLCVSSYHYICVLTLLCLCFHTTRYVSAYHYMCPHTTICILILLCVLILLHMCPHTTTCVLILLYMCPHTTTYVSSYYTIHVSSTSSSPSESFRWGGVSRTRAQMLRGGGRGGVTLWVEGKCRYQGHRQVRGKKCGWKLRCALVRGLAREV